MTSFTLLSTSLREDSQSRALLAFCADRLRHAGRRTHWFDLRDFPPVLCNGDEEAPIATYPQPFPALHSAMQQSAGTLVGMPIYLYSTAGPTKNVLDIIGDALTGKPVGFLTAAGTPRSHLAVRDAMNCLQFEYEAFVYSKTVQVCRDDYDRASVEERTAAFCRGFTQFADALASLACVEAQAMNAY